MSAIRFGLTADWHLAAMGDRLNAEGHNSRLIDLAHCAEATIEGALEAECDLILHAGDWTHTWRPTPTVVALLEHATSKAVTAGVPIIGVEGNHDQPRSVADVAGPYLFRHTAGTWILDRPEILHVWKGEAGITVALEQDLAPGPGGGALALQVACLPWPRRELLLASERTRGKQLLEINQMMREAVMDIVRGLAARLDPTIPAVLLAHVPVEEAQIGKQTMAVSGEWTLSVQELLALPFDYIALGHIHKGQGWRREVVGEGMAVYSGSPEAVFFGEEGQEKGWALVDMADAVTSYQIMPTPYRRLLTIDSADWEDGTPGPDVKDMIVRLRVRPQDKAQADAIRQDLAARGAHEIRVEILPEEIVRRREVDLAAEDSLETGIDAWLAQHPDLADRREPLLEEARLIEKAAAEREA